MIGVILAAGKGTRMRRIGAAIPKALIPIAGLPTIDHMFDMMIQAEIRDIILVVGHKKEMLMSYVGDGSEFGLNVTYVVQPEQRGIAHALSLVRGWAREDFLCLLGDTILIPKDALKRLKNAHLEHHPAATLLVKKVSDPSGYGVISPGLNNRVEEMVEKPAPGKAPSQLAATGAYIFSPRIFDAIEKTGPNPISGELEITDSINRLLEDGHEVRYLEFDGLYLDTGKLEALPHVDRALREVSFKASHPRKVDLFSLKVGEEKEVYPLFEWALLGSACTVLPPGSSTKGHYHMDSEEVYVFVSGEGEMELGKERIKVFPGLAIFIEPGEFHRVHNLGTEPMRFVAVYIQGAQREYRA
jgi:dTDP-glucose pyrophosphorylase